jgi:hypothetical protein
MAHASSLAPSRVEKSPARTLRPKHIREAIGLLIGGVLVLAAVVVGLVLVGPSIERTLDGIDRAGWFFIVLFVMCWKLDYRLEDARKKHEETLRLLRALQAMVEQQQGLAPKPVIPLSSAGTTSAPPVVP